MKVRTRIAPSPTGFVHIGFIHNALFTHALARHNGGNFILRIEDTDQKRFVEGATENLYEMLDEFNLKPDEGPREGGPFAPYIQSLRMKKGIYKQAAERLVENDNAYYCFLSQKELVKLKSSPEYKNRAFRSPHRNLSKEEVQKRIKNKEKYVIRLKVPEDEIIEVKDAILGKVQWNSNDIDDQVLLKSDGFPTYHLAVVIDDHDMMITHVTRSYEWLPSTPKQILLYKYLGFNLPVFAHSSLVLDPDGGKLSKRKGNVSAKQFIIEGYLVEAIKNFLMLLGWTPPIERKHGQKEREIFSHNEFIRMYKLEDRQKTNGVFNRDKLIWFNQQYIKTKSTEELADIFIRWLKNYAIRSKYQKILINKTDKKKLASQLELVKERGKTLVEIMELIKFFYIQPKDINWEIKQMKNFKDKEEIKLILDSIHNLIDTFDEKTSTWKMEEWQIGIQSIAKKFNKKAGDIFMIHRIAITGKPISPPLFESLQILGKKEIMTRLEIALPK